MNRRWLCLVFLLVTSGIPLAVQAQTLQIYQKLLPDKQSLIVTRTEVLKDKPTPQEVADTAKWLKGNPGLSLTSNDYAYLYAYILTSGDGKQRQTLWTTKEGTFGPAALPGHPREGSMTVEVLDVSVEKGATLIVVYKQGGFNHANIIQPGQGNRIQLPWPETNLPVPISGLDGVIVSGKISGSLNSYDLQVQLTSATKKIFSYRWQNNRWLLISKAELPAKIPESPINSIAP